MATSRLTSVQPTPFMNSCSRIFRNYIIYVFLIYVISGLGKACKFPRYLETSAIWVATYNEKGTLQGYFQGNLLKASRCDLEGNCFEYQRKCLLKREDNKYEVQHNSRGGSKPPMYLCMQILQRGRSIIQIRESQELYFRSPNACIDEHLILDNWPMVTAENFNDQKIPCPFSGGYNIRLHTSDKQPKCDREIIPARLESECERGDGLTIDFHNRDCLEKDLEMKVEQSLYCAATWTHGNYTFLILRPQNDEFKAWCMRITGTDFTKPIEHGHLFVDLVCDPGDGNGNIRETSNYLYLEFTQRIISSTCADSYSRICDDDRLCKYNDETYAINCRRFCNYCPVEQNSCSFPGSLQGEWVENTYGEQNQVIVSYYDIDITSTGRFQCHEQDGHDFENSTTLLQTFDNGCYPRYACFEVKKVSSSILEYRLGNRISWPVKNWDKIRENVCAEEMFEPNSKDKEQFGRNIVEKPGKIVVDMHHHYLVSCDLHNWLGLTDSRIYMEEVNVCEYCFVYDTATKHSKQRFIAQPFNCTSNGSLNRKDYHCLGVFPQDETTHAVVTRTMHAHQEYLCWVFVNEGNRDDREGIVYVLDATDCNKVAIKSVREGNYEPKRTIIIPKAQKRACPYLGPLLPATTSMVYQTPTPVHGENSGGGRGNTNDYNNRNGDGTNFERERTTYYSPVYPYNSEHINPQRHTTIQPPYYSGTNSKASVVVSASILTVPLSIIVSLSAYT